MSATLQGRWYSPFSFIADCELCERNFGEESDFNKHQAIHSRKDGVYSCSYCSARFKRYMYIEFLPQGMRIPVESYVFPTPPRTVVYRQSIGRRQLALVRWMRESRDAK